MGPHPTTLPHSHPHPPTYPSAHLQEALKDADAAVKERASLVAKARELQVSGGLWFSAGRPVGGRLRQLKGWCRQACLTRAR